jgi:hypothetical protein
VNGSGADTIDHINRKKLEEVKKAAPSVLDDPKAEKTRKRQQWRDKAKTFMSRRNKEETAVIPCRMKATDKKPAEDVEVLLDDKDRVELHARSANGETAVLIGSNPTSFGSSTRVGHRRLHERLQGRSVASPT